MLYNIRYGTGGKRFILPTSGYFRTTGGNLSRIVRFIGETNPDIIGLVEVDFGSYRSHRRNQAQVIADSLECYHTYRCKYRTRSLISRIPVINKQGNAFIARDSIINEKFHYFTTGVKRLVIELEMNDFVIFLVHLSLGFRVRHHQLSDLYDLVKKVRKPCIVAGDFNSLWGEGEINLFLGATGLVNANTEGKPSFPSWAPRRHLDFVLHSSDIRITDFFTPGVQFSDHLPLVCDFEISK